MGPKKRVLFVCTGNSARSQIAEGLLRHISKGAVEVFSAGTDPQPVHPLAVRVMGEANVDISGHRSKSVATFAGESFDFVITVCDRAKENSPPWPGKVDYIHWSIDDPAPVDGPEGRAAQGVPESAGRAPAADHAVPPRQSDRVAARVARALTPGLSDAEL